jgi:hypothetical protein
MLKAALIAAAFRDGIAVLPFAIVRVYAVEICRLQKRELNPLTNPVIAHRKEIENAAA